MSVMQAQQYPEASSSHASFKPPVPATWQDSDSVNSLVGLLSDEIQYSSLAELFAGIPSFLHASPPPQLPTDV